MYYIGLIVKGTGALLLAALCLLNVVAGLSYFGIHILPEQFGDFPWKLMLFNPKAPIMIIPAVFVPSILTFLGEVIMERSS